METFSNATVFPTMEERRRIWEAYEKRFRPDDNPAPTFAPADWFEEEVKSND